MHTSVLTDRNAVLCLMRRHNAHLVWSPLEGWRIVTPDKDETIGRTDAPTVAAMALDSLIVRDSLHLYRIP